MSRPRPWPDYTRTRRRRRWDTLRWWLGLFVIVMLGIFGGGWLLGVIVADWMGV